MGVPDRALQTHYLKIYSSEEYIIVRNLVKGIKRVRHYNECFIFMNKFVIPDLTAFTDNWLGEPWTSEMKRERI